MHSLILYKQENNANYVELNILFVLGKGLRPLLESGYIIKRHILKYKKLYNIVTVNNAIYK